LKGYLIDTSILSAFAPGKPVVAPEVSAWIAAQGDAGALYIPVIAVAEIEKGVRKLQRAGAQKRAERLIEWLDGLVRGFSDRVLNIDANVTRKAGEMDEAAIAKGQNPGLADVLIAATAAVHELTVVTANTRHFEPLEVWCWNILQDPPVGED
jgi:predicted nucleic acid-binding protein